MKIYRCVKTNKISQWFGENKVSFYKRMGMKGHNGIDFACPMKEKVYWDGSIKGKVIKTILSATAGFGVVVLTEEKNERFRHVFWHLMAITVKPGQVVETGDLIGLADSTGKYCTGPHVHRGLYKVDKDYKIINYNNGYHGAIDPKPYLENIFVLEKIQQLKAEISRLQRLIEAVKRSLQLLKR